MGFARKSEEGRYSGGATVDSARAPMVTIIIMSQHSLFIFQTDQTHFKQKCKLEILLFKNSMKKKGDKSSKVEEPKLKKLELKNSKNMSESCKRHRTRSVEADKEVSNVTVQSNLTKSAKRRIDFNNTKEGGGKLQKNNNSTKIKESNVSADVVVQHDKLRPKWT